MSQQRIETPQAEREAERADLSRFTSQEWLIDQLTSAAIGRYMDGEESALGEVHRLSKKRVNLMTRAHHPTTEGAER